MDSWYECCLSGPAFCFMIVVARIYTGEDLHKPDPIAFFTVSLCQMIRS